MVSRLAHARLHTYNNCTLAQLRKLDRDHTVVLFPVGMSEQHGNHLPLGTDTFAVESIVTSAATWLLEHDQRLHVLVLPSMPFGTDPVESRRPELFTAAGGIWLGRDTLKQVIYELAVQIIGYGFRYIFPVGFHGGKDQVILLAEVCDELRAQYPGVTVYEPMAYIKAGFSEDMVPGLATLLGRPLTPSEEVTLRNSIHASMMETSMMLYLQPDLVDASYQALQSIEWADLYRMEDWPGYVGAGPRHANPDIGAAMLRWWGVRTGELIRQAMSGEDLSDMPRFPRWYYDDQEDPPILSERDPVDRPLHVDSKPAMYFSSKEVADRLQQARQEDSGPPADEDDDATKPSSANQTQVSHHRSTSSPFDDADSG